MTLVNFNPAKPTPEEITKAYEECKAGIELYFDPSTNPLFNEVFANLTQTEIDRREKHTLDELSLRSSFYLLCYIESLFRMDFILRIESHRKGNNDALTKAFKSLYNPLKRPYTYSLVDDIFSNWKQYIINKPNSKEMTDILNTLPQYFDFRNWIAHGRYWIFNESNYLRKYNFTQILILLGNLEAFFGEYLKKKNYGIIVS